MEENDKEKVKRLDTTIGIIIASIMGFLLNLLASIYYGLFITKSVKWEDINQNQILYILLLLVGLFGFLLFFINDYKNKIEINTSFFKRFSDYFFYKFGPGRILRYILGIYLLITLIGLMIMLFIFINKVSGISVALVIFSVALLVFSIQEKRKKKQKKQE